jgi:hypothetical protein
MRGNNLSRGFSWNSPTLLYTRIIVLSDCCEISHVVRALGEDPRWVRYVNLTAAQIPPTPTIQGPKQPKGDIGREYSGQCWRSMGRSVVLFRKVVKDRYTISDFHNCGVDNEDIGGHVSARPNAP